MASLRKRRGTWYARVQWWIGQKRKELNIPLRTKKKIVARERISEVERVEEHIKEGNQFSFPWMHNTVKTKVIRLTIKEAVIKWMNERKHLIRKNAMLINQNSLNHLINTLGGTTHLSNIDNSAILLYNRYLINKNYSIASINIHLRTVKTMLRYYQKIGMLKKIPSVDQMRVYQKDPIYISDNEFNMIMALPSLSSFYKRIFFLYRETGMRLREAYISILNGHWLDISEESKSHRSRSLELNSYLKTIYLEYENWFKEGYGATLKDPGEHISKMFKKCLIHIKASSDKSFHSLRHTYAVRSLIKGVPIHELKLLMGHSSVITTEGYCNMNLKRIAHDFPSIHSTLAEHTLENSKEDTPLEDTMNPIKEYVPLLPHLEA